MTRVISNAIDAAVTEKSRLASDSRFQLTPKEANALIKRQYSIEDINIIKNAIQGLAVRALGMQEVGVFGTKDAYKEIEKQLTALKKGEISDDIRKLYGDDPQNSPQSHSGPRMSS